MNPADLRAAVVVEAMIVVSQPARRGRLRVAPVLPGGGP